MTSKNDVLQKDIDQASSKLIQLFQKYTTILKESENKPEEDEEAVAQMIYQLDKHREEMTLLYCELQRLMLDTSDTVEKLKHSDCTEEYYNQALRNKYFSCDMMNYYTNLAHDCSELKVKHCPDKCLQ